MQHFACKLLDSFFLPILVIIIIFFFWGEKVSSGISGNVFQNIRGLRVPEPPPPQMGGNIIYNCMYHIIIVIISKIISQIKKFLRTKCA